MTTIGKATRRVTAESLGYFFGADSDRRLVVSFERPDILTLRPLGTRRTETILLRDVYRIAIQGRVTKQVMQELRDRKAAKTKAREERAWKRGIAKANKGAEKS